MHRRRFVLGAFRIPQVRAAISGAVAATSSMSTVGGRMRRSRPRQWLSASAKSQVEKRPSARQRGRPRYAFTKASWATSSASAGSRNKRATSFTTLLIETPIYLPAMMREVL